MSSVTVSRNSLLSLVALLVVGIGIAGGTLFILLGPPMTLAVVRHLATLPPHDLHHFLLTILRSLPSTLGATMYVAAAAGSCLLQATDEDNIINQCGNPLAPTFFVTILLGTIWVIGVILPYVLPPEETGWTDIASMSVEKTEARKITLVTILSSLTVLLYAMTYEDGAKVTKTMIVIAALFCFVFCLLTALTAWQIVTPFLFGTGGAKEGGDGSTWGRDGEGGENRTASGLSSGTSGSRRARKSDAFTWLGTSSSML